MRFEAHRALIRDASILTRRANHTRAVPCFQARWHVVARCCTLLRPQMSPRNCGTAPGRNLALTHGHDRRIYERCAHTTLERSMTKKLKWIPLVFSLSSAWPATAAKVTIDDLMRLRSLSEIRISP